MKNQLQPIWGGGSKLQAVLSLLPVATPGNHFQSFGQFTFLALYDVISFPNSCHPPYELPNLLIFEHSMQWFMFCPFTKYLHFVLKA